MADLATLRDLHRRLREATGPDRELDADICVALKYVGGNLYVAASDIIARDNQLVFLEEDELLFVDVPRLTLSIGAAIALIERMLPNCAYLAGKGRETASEPLYGVLIYRRLSAGSGELGVGEHPSLFGAAACIALVSALIAIEEGKGEMDG